MDTINQLQALKAELENKDNDTPALNIISKIEELIDLLVIYEAKALKTYKVIWEVSKYAIVKAKNEEEAIEFVHAGKVEEFENEITAPPMAYEK